MGAGVSPTVRLPTALEGCVGYGGPSANHLVAEQATVPPTPLKGCRQPSDSREPRGESGHTRDSLGVRPAARYHLRALLRYNGLRDDPT